MRITPELVKRAYEATGLRPRTGTWGSMNSNCGCPLSVVCVAMEQGHPGDSRSPSLHAGYKLGLSPEYIVGFIRGVDHLTFGGWGSENPEEYQQAFTDGQAVQQMMSKGL